MKCAFCHSRRKNESPEKSRQKLDPQPEPTIRKDSGAGMTMRGIS